MKRISLLLLSLAALQSSAFSEDEDEHKYDFIPNQELKTVHKTLMEYPEIFLEPYLNEKQLKRLKHFSSVALPDFTPRYDLVDPVIPWYQAKPKPKPKNNRVLDFCKKTYGVGSETLEEIWYPFSRDEWNHSPPAIREAAVFHEIAIETGAEPAETCELTRKFKTDREKFWSQAEKHSLKCQIQVDSQETREGILKEGAALALSIEKNLQFKFSFNADPNERGILIREQDPRSPDSKSKDRFVLISPYLWIDPVLFGGQYQFKSSSGYLVRINCSLDKE